MRQIRPFAAACFDLAVAARWMRRREFGIGGPVGVLRTEPVFRLPGTPPRRRRCRRAPPPNRQPPHPPLRAGTLRTRILPNRRRKLRPPRAPPRRILPGRSRWPRRRSSRGIWWARSPSISGSGCGVNLMLGTGDTQTLLDGFAWASSCPKNREGPHPAARTAGYLLSVGGEHRFARGGPGNGQTLYVFEQEPQVMLARREDGAIIYSYYTAPDNCYGYIYEMARRCSPATTTSTCRWPTTSPVSIITRMAGSSRRRRQSNTTAGCSSGRTLGTPPPSYRQQAGSAKPDPAIGLTRDPDRTALRRVYLGQVHPGTSRSCPLAGR